MITKQTIYPSGEYVQPRFITKEEGGLRQMDFPFKPIQHAAKL